MSKPVIAIDIDDVLGDETEAVRLFVNQHLGLNLSRQDYLVDGEYKGYWESIWGTAREQGEEVYEAYVASGSKYNHVPVEGAIDAIAQLKRRYKLVIVTARGERHVENTHRWLVQHYADAFSHVEFMPLWGDDVTKAHIAGTHGASYLIDDNYDHCRIAAEAGMEALLFGEYGWSRTREIHPGITRVKNWTAVLEYFDGRG